MRLFNLFRFQRPIVVAPQAEKALLDMRLKGEDGLPILLPQILEMVRSEMANHDTTDKNPTFHHIPVGNVHILVDNSPKELRIPRVFTKDEFLIFWYGFNTFYNEHTVH